MPGVAYTGFVDPSGGSSNSFSLGVAHRSPSGIPVLDLVRETKPPFSPEAVTLEFSRTLKAYGISTVVGDRFGGAWVSEQFKKFGIAYVASELTRSDLYLETLPSVNSGAIELLE